MDGYSDSKYKTYLCHFVVFKAHSQKSHAEPPEKRRRLRDSSGGADGTSGGGDGDMEDKLTLIQGLYIYILFIYICTHIYIYIFM